MSRWNLAWLLGINAVALLGLTIAYSAPPQEENKKYGRARLFIDVMDEVERNFVRKLSDDELREVVENMINGGLARLDPYSSFINNKKRREFDKHSRGKFGGIGIQIHADRQSGLLTVISPIVGTPAYEAGIQAGDMVYKIDGKSTENMTLEEAVDRITGDKGQPIVLSVLHEGDKSPVDIKIIRDIIEVESVLGDRRQADNPKKWDFVYDKDNKIAYIRLVAFNENSAGELRAVVERLEGQGIRGLVLDLRFNPGGLLTSAVEISNLFLPEGSRIVSIRGRNSRERAYDAQKEGTVLGSAKEVPMVVLVNRSSASASEIVSAALQDHGRAVVIGERSFGKGSVQNVIELENKTSVLKLTTASYWRPSGKNIHRHPDSKDTDEWGVKPNEDPNPVRPALLTALAWSPAPVAAAPFWPGLYWAMQKKLPGRFEVNLSDWERYQYQVDRYQKDIVKGKAKKGGPRSKTPPKKTSKEPFHDRVLDRAIDYLREQIKSHNAPPPVAKVVNG